VLPRTDGGPILVYVNGDAPTPSMPCGSKANPCLTISDGVAAAAVLAGSTVTASVWIAAGTYTESVILSSGVSLQGGYGPDWTLPDGGDAGAGTVVRGVSSNTITATNLTAPATISNLTLTSTGSPKDGESVFGVFASSDTDAGAPLVLADVIVTLGRAGNGVPGVKGEAGATAPATCTGVGNPTSGATGADAVSNGTFSATGFVPGSGSNGGNGGVGLTGAVGVQTCDSSCVAGCSIGICDMSASKVCAAGAAGGCGGGGGLGGTGGGGGGSSVALFAWNVPVTVHNGALRSGNGGAGASGGGGGSGAGGAAPGAAPTAACPTSCTYQGANCANTDTTVTGGNGTSGGPGGAGGGGGAGAGGSTYSVYYAGLVPSFVGNVVYAQGVAGTGSPLGVASPTGSPP
jgi:hypothetical protein